MTLAEKIVIRRRQQLLFKRAERVIRACHQRCFDMEDAGLSWKYERMVKNCKRILKPLRDAHRRAWELQRSTWITD